VTRSLSRAALVAVIAIGALAYGTLDKTVTLRVDGRAAVVHTYATTVGSLLAHRGLRVGAHDAVRPSPASPLRNGETVELRHAKDVIILLNGKPRRIVTTALSVQELLADLRLRHSLLDYVSASRSARIDDGMELVYREAVAVLVRHDGLADQIITNAPDVSTLLREMGLRLGRRDVLRPGPKTYPTDGMTVTVTRIAERREDVRDEIPYATEYRQDPNMAQGTRRTVLPGVPGVRVTHYVTTYADGKPVSRRMLGSQVVREPVTQIVAVGAGSSCTCDAGSETGDASWYGHSGLTAAHPWLPFGTVVRVTNLATGAWVDVTINDRGPYVRGRIIDLSQSAFSRIASTSEGVIRVTIRW
jgi:uncharacterized protein YabE (DUF348 family)